MPLTLLDELPPTGPVPVFGLLRIHRHKGHAMPGLAPDAPSGTFLPQTATAARAPQSRELCARRSPIEAMADHPESALYG
jgi:hypothetical protein